MKRRDFEISASDSELIDKLPPDQQMVLRTRGSYKEIAQTLHVPVGTVKSRLNRARNELEKKRMPPVGSQGFE